MPRQKPFADTDLDQAEEPIDVLAKRPPAARRGALKRKRAWERKQREDPETMQVTFRGIPRGLNDELKAVAAEHGVTVAEIARLFLEFGLASYAAGNLKIQTREMEVKRAVDFEASPSVGE